MRFIPLISFVVFSTGLHSCLVTTSPRRHYFISNESNNSQNPKLLIFSTPKYKDYIVINIDTQSKIFIKSPVFKNPTDYYLMKFEKYYATDAKQFRLVMRDREFYRSNIYDSIFLKIIKDGEEKIIAYKPDH